MNYYIFVLILYFRCDSVKSQIPPIFGSQNPNSQGPPVFGSQNINDLTNVIGNDGRQLVNPSDQCYCALIASCTGIPLIPGRDNFNNRILNIGPINPDSCPTNYVLCCSGIPQPTNPVCGRRKVALTSTVGDVAPYGAYPWHAALFHRLSDQYIGAAVVLTSTYLITVAHRVVGLNNNFRIRLGLWSLSANSYPYFEANPIFYQLHGNFNRNTLQNDIAVIQIDRAIPFANYVSINSACLPTSVPAAGTRCWTSGWGVTAFNSGQYQNLLRHVEVPIVSQAACEASLRNTRLGFYFNLDRTSFLCAGGESGRDSCTGDGGGALVCEVATNQFQVVGLTSWGVGCGQIFVPGIYLNVYNYLSVLRNFVSVTANSG
ncbi:phenoloxidase-activating factor 2-like [Leptopilina heterotoma]|uniref:phenoloxidase-activating factor 2-like n=1 Tax=Leptopilina heterotoma TaxID=63436 RepID=UPI001CA87A8D|nr:phenoloxidase-activating factor 2-like [Leptopilina heterotoma]